jgi:hypothetical protein
VYPKREIDGKATIQRIADRLERLEGIISQEKGLNTEPETQVEESRRKSVSIQCSHEPWELLLHDGKAVQYVNNSNIKDLLQDVS